MPPIVLTTLNARYIHASIGLRSLYANLHELQTSTTLIEFTIADRLTDVAEQLLLLQPRIIGIGTYIWNAAQVEQLVRLLRTLSPDTIIVLGGPEVSHPPYRINLEQADYVVEGEGERSFLMLCRTVLGGGTAPPKHISCQPADPDTLCLPYAHYTDADIAQRTIYVEASRGCPYRCEFCLSSIDRQVRYFPLEPFLNALDDLWQRGARNIKFIDRTFNLDINRVVRILDFFLARQPPYLVHFEVVPDHFPPVLKKALSRFSPGTLQLEVGIQTLDPTVAATIYRRLDMKRIQENLHFLEHETSAHLHLDLIAGLPGESLTGFGDNLNTLVSMTSGEIQLGVLKKLSGTTIDRHDQAYSMCYSPFPPYELLANASIPFADMQAFKRFARYWDLLFNSGNFQQSVQLLWLDTDTYSGFAAFSSWLYDATRATWQISLQRLAEYLFRFLVEKKQQAPSTVADTIAGDLLKVQGRRLPSNIREHTSLHLHKGQQQILAGPGKRQRKHLRLDK